jgi:eukaryotic-like serine/threonine-protein kinase
MTPEIYREAGNIFARLRELPDNQRAAALDAACGANSELRAQVVRLLEADRDAAGGFFLERHAIEDAAQLVPDTGSSLAPGTVIGNYCLGSRIGAGGMGIVYEAQDLRLHRRVAIKILPLPLAGEGAERVKRFQREVRAASLLNHPNILSIFDADFDRGHYYMATELVEGKTLRQLIAAEPQGLESKTVLDLVAQIASALSAAHEAGIVHRDIKPENIMVRPDGFVKVLDFGLAKLREPSSDAAHEGSDLLTRPGHLAGTIQYLSPEQVAGKQVDARSDLFSLGVVAYELATGTRPFDGPTDGAVYDAILNRTPAAPSSVRPSLGVELDGLIMRALEKDPELRFQTAGDLRSACKLQSRDSSHSHSLPIPSRMPGRRFGWKAAASAGVGLVCLGAAALSYFALLRPAAAPPPTSRFSVEAPPDTQFTNLYAATALSPDGRYVVFGAASGSETGAPLLWLRPLDSLAARQLLGTEGANHPFWSPDSKSIGFFAGGKLKRVETVGGPPLILCDAMVTSTAAVGGTWNRDGVILFGGVDGLRRIPASGGVPVLFTKTDAARQETGHGFPQFLPDGKHFLYFIASPNPRTQGVYAASLDNPRKSAQILQTDNKAIYSPPVTGRWGYLLWLREQTLLAERFDAGKLRMEGDPTPVAEGVAANTAQRAAFWASNAGLLAYRTGRAVVKSKLLWMSRDGTSIEKAGPDDYYGSFRLSADGKRIVLNRTDAAGPSDLWIFEFGRSVMTRITFDGKESTEPVWSPDGRQIAYLSTRTGSQLYRKDAAGDGSDEQLTQNPSTKLLDDWSPDGRYLLFYESNSRGGTDLLALPMEGERRPQVLAHITGTGLRGAQFSPDGKWIAYESNESGRFEIYIRPFTGEQSSPVGRWQVSNQGGVLPRWRRDGKELFYVSGSGAVDAKLMAVGVRSSATSVEADTPRELFPVSLPANVGFPYDVTSDGQRFLVLEATGGALGSAPLNIVLNWQAGLKR